MLGTVHSKAEIIKEIIIKGNSRLNEETIKVYGDFQLNTDINEIKINKILNDLYSTNFFEDIKIDFNNGKLQIYITEYPVINQLVLLGENSSRVKKEIKKPTINTDKLCNDSRVLYPLNMYELSSSEKNNLKKLSKYLKDNPNSILKIFGSTDKSGSEEYNMMLSTKRANSSKNFLLELGVASKQIETINLGESKSQNANSEQERAKARSTTFQVIIK